MLLEFVALITLIYSTFGQGRGQARVPSRPGVMQARPSELPLPGFTLNGPLPQPQMMPRASGGPGMERMRTRNVFGRTAKNSRGSRTPRFKGTHSGRRSNEMRMGMPGVFGRKPYVPPKPAVEVVLEGMPEGGFHPAEAPPGLW